MMRGSQSRSQKEKPDDKKRQHTVNSLVWKRRIIFHRSFPRDIMLEILSRATIEILDACTSVSKGWMNLIIDPSLIQSYQKKHDMVGLYNRKEWLDFISYHGFIYRKRNKKEFAGYFWQYCTVEYPHRRYRSIFVPFEEKNCDPSVHKWRIPEEMKILAACKQEGIVFCCDGKNYFVGMPAVSKWMIMPEPDDKDDFRKWLDVNYTNFREEFVFGMVVLGSSPLWYKIVKLAWMSSQLYYQIFDSKLRKWQKAGVVELYDRPMVSRSCPTVSVSGSIYWQTTNAYVLAFNGLNDSFHLFNLPSGTYDDDRMIHDFNGRLGCSYLIGCEMELWEITNNNRWRKRRDVHVNDVKTGRMENHKIWYTVEQGEIIIHGEEECYKCQIFPFGL